jgi:hypothetical protein
MSSTIILKNHQRTEAMPGDGRVLPLSHFFLEFQTRTSKSAREDLALLIDKLQKEVRIFVINVFDSILFKAAVLWFDLCPLNRFVH